MLIVINKLPGWENIRVAIYFPGGAMRGIHTAAMALALAQEGLLSEEFTFVGTSVGAIIAAYATQGIKGLGKGISLFFKEALSKTCTNFFRFWRILDVKKVIEAMSSPASKKHIPRANLRAQENLFVTASSLKGDLYFLQTSDAWPNPYEAIRASCSLPGADGRTVRVNSLQLIDGGVFNALPIEDLQFLATDILVLSNKVNKYAVLGKSLPKWQQLLLAVVLVIKHCFTTLPKQILAKGDGWANSLAKIANGQDITSNFAILEPSGIRIPQMLTDSLKNRDLLAYALKATSNKTHQEIKAAKEAALKELEKEGRLANKKTRVMPVLTKEEQLEIERLQIEAAFAQAIDVPESAAMPAEFSDLEKLQINEMLASINLQDEEETEQEPVAPESITLHETEIKMSIAEAIKEAAQRREKRKIEKAFNELCREMDELDAHEKKPSSFLPFWIDPDKAHEFTPDELEMMGFTVAKTTVNPYKNCDST